MKLKRGFVYEIRPGESLLIQEPRSGTPGTMFLTEGAVFLVLSEPIIEYESYDRKTYHSYYVFQRDRVFRIQAREDLIRYTVGFHTP